MYHKYILPILVSRCRSQISTNTNMEWNWCYTQ